MEALSDFSAKVKKAGNTLGEIRDTPNPGLLVQCLLPLLETIGSVAHVPPLRKRVRDSVNIDKAERPWRRHPFWLVLRVAIERQLCLTLGALEGRFVYKVIIITTLLTLLKQCPNRLSAEMTLLLKRKVCRRLSKLEMEATQQEDDSSTHRHLLNTITPGAKEAIEVVSNDILSTWTRFKQQKTRKIHRLSYAQCRPSDQDYVLPLRCSGGFLDSLLRNYSSQTSQWLSPHTLHITDEGVKMVQKFTTQYRELADFENTLAR